jgi:hypothetical protein
LDESGNMSLHRLDIITLIREDLAIEGRNSSPSVRY